MFQKWQDEIIKQEYDNDEDLFISNRCLFEMDMLES